MIVSVPCKPLAKDMGATLAQFALGMVSAESVCQQRYHRGQPCPSRWQENMKALDFAGQFTPDLMAEIDRIIGA